MTTPEQRTAAVLQTREFLQELLSSAYGTGLPDDVRLEAERLLRHFPGRAELHAANVMSARMFAAPPPLEPK